MERIKKERQELCKIVEVLEKERDYLDQQIWNKEMQFAKEYEQVSGMWFVAIHWIRTLLINVVSVFI